MILDEVAGGPYWRDILDRFRTGEVDFGQAEQEFIEAYIKLLQQHFNHAIQLPIKARSHHMPKYRLVFATDHADGVILMNDNMHSTWEALIESEQGGQLYLFDSEDVPPHGHVPIETKVWKELETPTALKELLISLIKTYGFQHTTSQYKQSMKDHEGRMFDIDRRPATTATGKASRAMDYTKAEIYLKRLPTTPTMI